MTTRAVAAQTLGGVLGKRPGIFLLLLKQNIERLGSNFDMAEILEVSRLHRNGPPHVIELADFGA
jgi:hypothetical protein